MCDSPVADFVGEDTNFVSAKEPELPAVPRVGKLDCSMTLLADKSTYNQVNHCLNVSMNAIIISSSHNCQKHFYLCHWNCSQHA
jgi:hypothetical protein